MDFAPPPGQMLLDSKKDALVQVDGVHDYQPN
jgi:hypothetical protein